LGKPKEKKGRAFRSALCVNGCIELTRTRFGNTAQGSEYTCDRLVDETEAAVSVGARQLCVREGCNARSFDRGRENLAHAAQIVVGEERFRQLVEGDGKNVLRLSGDEQLELDWSASQCKTQTPDGGETTRVYVSADGVLVPTTTQSEKDKRRATVLKKRKDLPREKRKKLKALGRVRKGSDQRYKQIYVTIFYDQDQKHRLVGVTCKKVKGLKRLLKTDAARVRLRAAQERLGMVDGAVCLRNHLDLLSLNEVLLDFYHNSEHVGEAAAKTLGAETEAAKQWLGKVLHTLRHEGYEPFFQHLLDWRAPLRGAKRKAADELINYVASREEMIIYEQCDPRGWDVGSGPMESMCGVTTERIKGRGRRWNLENAEAMMGLEALYQSTGLWNRYWQMQLAHQN
jgi:hypothetical protein